MKDLRHLPVLSIEEVQNQYADLVSEAVPKKEQIITHTSGTTGGGLRFATTLKAIQEQWATWWRYRHWHGLHQGIWCGYFGGCSVVPLPQTSPPFWRYNYPGKQILFSGYHLNPANLVVYVEELRRRKPPWLHGYPSLLALLASRLLETGNDLDYQVRWVTIGAENLLIQQADLIERAFGVRPKQHYGMTEAVANISECEFGKLHVDEDFAAVEFVPNPRGTGFKVLGTNFTNPATPFLRYDVKDLVELADISSCQCGRPGRVVENIDGRKEDYVTLKNGARLGRLDHIFKDLVNIREAQIVQKKAGEVIIRVVKGKDYSEKDTIALLQETSKRMGDDTDILIEHLDSLPRGPSGKMRFVVSEISAGKLEI
jgi:phenylacetate-CoA ligase